LTAEEVKYLYQNWCLVVDLYTGIAQAVPFFMPWCLFGLSFRYYLGNYG
jgi:hypothetical protein